MSAKNRAEYELQGSYSAKTLHLLGHALRTEPKRFAIAITAAGVFGVLTVVFGSLLGVIVDDVVIPAINREPIGGWWGEQTQDAASAVLLAGAAFVSIGLVNAGQGCAAPDRRRAALARPRTSLALLPTLLNKGAHKLRGIRLNGIIDLIEQRVESVK